MQRNPKIATNVAADFLARCFAPGETIALLLRRESPAATLQRIVPLERALAPRFLGWLAHENSNGANVYVAANPLRSGSRKRTKESIASVRHLYIDIDIDGEARLDALQRSNAVPVPTAILSTSPGKYQALWRVEEFDFERQESMLKMLAIAFGGDPACTDCNRVLRIPGFLNCKYDPAHVITVEHQCDSVWSPNDFQSDIPAAEAGFLGGVIPPRKNPRTRTHSECDWAWVLRELRDGKDAVKLTRGLALRRSDKPNPIYYAQRTVDVASAMLWLIGGVPFADVITMLEVRRRFELPTAICSARAREIALTAQCMITRQKIA